MPSLRRVGLGAGVAAPPLGGQDACLDPFYVGQLLDA